jgi:site-specific DNA-adenine methylase
MVDGEGVMAIKTGLGLPYMGSKRKIAPALMNLIIRENPKAKYFFDLFGGGAAMSLLAIQMQQFKRVVYNELNTGVVELLRDIRDNGITDKYYQWIDRETFHKHKDADTWLGGLCKVIWSFGNKQTAYLFGADIEEDKRLLHEIIVNDCQQSLTKFNTTYNLNLEPAKKQDSILIENLSEKRIRVMRQVKRDAGQRMDLQQLQRLQRLQRLEIHNLSFEQVIIDTPPEETIIYLDPPYKNTATYQEELCHEQLYKYIESSPCKIYLSSYESHLPCVFEIQHRSTLSSTKNNKVVIEKLFVNR